MSVLSGAPTKKSATGPCRGRSMGENEAFGCKMAGKKMSKKELAWAILRNVREHNKMVDGVKMESLDRAGSPMDSTSTALAV